VALDNSAADRLDALERAVGDLIDQTAIKETLLRYANGVDRRDFDAVRSCFVEGAVIHGSLGDASIEDYCHKLSVELRQYRRTMHFIGNQYVDIRGDSATLQTYAVAFHFVDTEPSPRDLVVGVRYADEFVRSNSSWLVLQRRVEADFVGARFERRDGGGATFNAQTPDAVAEQGS
jgi:hypothetical protein